jgi:hypothetical protein
MDENTDNEGQRITEEIESDPAEVDRLRESIAQADAGQTATAAELQRRLFASPKARAAYERLLGEIEQRMIERE